MAKTGKRVLTIIGWIAGVIAGLLLLLVLYVNLAWDAKSSRSAPAFTAPADSASRARGEYIFMYQAQCWSCHQTPPAGGMMFDLTNAGPGFGKWYSRNLTPDHVTGLGGWSDGEIIQALREGMSRDRTTLFPIMPVDWYHGMADDDALALVAYLRSLPPVVNKVPSREPSFVAKALLAFNVIQPKDPVAGRVMAPERGVTAEYGKYLSSNLAGCAECHTPRNMQDGKFYLDSLFAGGSFAFGGGVEGPVICYARNITPDNETGIGSWSEDQFIETVTTGVRPDGSVLAPVMPYAYYKFWNTDDLRAIFTYLKTVRAFKRTVPPVRSEHRLQAARGTERGAILFEGRCQSCHGKNGGGAMPTHVKLSEVSASLTDDELKEFITSGQMNLKMPSFGKTLSKEELGDVIAFIRTFEAK